MYKGHRLAKDRIVQRNAHPSQAIVYPRRTVARLHRDLPLVGESGAQKLIKQWPVISSHIGKLLIAGNEDALIELTFPCKLTATQKRAKGYSEKLCRPGGESILVPPLYHTAILWIW